MGREQVGIGWDPGAGTMGTFRPTCTLGTVPKYLPALQKVRGAESCEWPGLGCPGGSR